MWKKDSMTAESTGRPDISYQNIAGALLFIAGVIVFLGITTAEAVYPGYSTSQNMISDLGATVPPNSIIVQPAATIFNFTMIISGLCIIFSAYFLYRSSGMDTFTVTLALFGIGVFGVGIFPGNFGAIHAIFALLAFLFGGITAIVSYRQSLSPLNYFSVILGLLALLDLLLYYILGMESPFAFLGPGGLERWIAYPIVLWVIGFGGYLMGLSQSHSSGK